MRGEPGGDSSDAGVDIGQSLGLAGFPTEVTLNGTSFPRTALQYLETHDHSRLLAATAGRARQYPDVDPAFRR